jgi:hypothetical protein
VKFYAVFKGRDFGETWQPGGAVAIERFAFDAVGGCKSAKLVCNDEDEWALFDLLERLRQPVEIRNERGGVIWWGYVHEVQVSVGAIQIGASLDTMSNSVAVAYSQSAPGSTGSGERATTSYSTDADSVAEYGTKQLLVSLSDAAQSMAEARRAAMLDLVKLPIPVVAAGEGDKRQALLNLRGWFDTVRWKYYTHAAGREVYEDLGGAATQAFGDAAARVKVGQSLALPSAGEWLLAQVDVHLKKFGTPADNVVVKIYSDVAGAPGVLLATSAAVAGANVPDSLSWVEFSFSAPYITIEYGLAGTTYWIVVERSGGADAANYYAVDANTDLGYTRGVFRVYNGAAWVARSPDADMPFRMLGVMESNDLVSDTITGAGQFITSVEMPASGVYSGLYRDGDQSGLDVLLDLLAAGNSSGKRFLCEVTQGRALRVWAEPAQGDAPDLFLTRDGELLDRTLAPIADSPVGQWVFLKDVIPPSLDLMLVSDPKWAFIERAEFDVVKGKWRPEFRGTVSPWTVGEVVAG